MHATMEKITESGAVFRDLSNPDKRNAIRADFPDIMGLSRKSSACILEVLDRQLALYGTNLKEAGRINIAYPHKHPEKRKGHVNAATDVAQNFKTSMTRVAPDTEWVRADSIYEESDLGRSEDQSCLHTLTNRHCFAVDPDLQKSAFPFLDPDNDKQEYFIIVDGWVEQGTTIANLMSYIEYNGGVVLAAGVEGNIIYGSNNFLVQHTLRSPDIQNDFNRAGAERVPEIAAALARSANKTGFFSRKKKHSPETCAAIFELALNRHGKSLETLTNGECNKLLETIGDPLRGQSFSGLVEYLYNKPSTPS
ncbi:MAG: hypothetical protein CO093_03860 [Alphaproteobacteria bacterium CG_4_9_14_3_um_filter_47_13]|nr:MAG: hypothetical protein CO093_03860 [Alphaproteobacteria bacterium CG_4_9_14_3_um_filter_47_13]